MIKIYKITKIIIQILINNKITLKFLLNKTSNRLNPKAWIDYLFNIIKGFNKFKIIQCQSID